MIVWCIYLQYKSVEIHQPCHKKWNITFHCRIFMKKIFMTKIRNLSCKNLHLRSGVSLHRKTFVFPPWQISCNLKTIKWFWFSNSEKMKVTILLFLSLINLRSWLFPQLCPFPQIWPQPNANFCLQKPPINPMYIHLSNYYLQSVGESLVLCWCL